MNQAWKEACAALDAEDAFKPPTLHSIALFHARKCGVPLNVFRGMGRDPELCKARWEAWHDSKLAGKSSTVIGRYYGDRDHSTILYGIRKHRGEGGATRKSKVVNGTGTGVGNAPL